MTGSPPPQPIRRHPIFARFYARISPAMDAQGAAEHRRALLAGLAGRVLEVGAGNGRNFAHYPSTVTDVLAVEPEPYLRGLAQVAAGQAPVPVRVVDGTADAVPTPDASMDAAVASLVLCSVPDQARAPPGAALRWGAALFRARPGPTPLAWPASSASPTSSGPPCWAAVTPAATPLAAITDAGFQITSVKRFRFPESRLPQPAAPHVLGVAHRPTSPRPRTACARYSVSRNLRK
jgi:SAM-dependent methyltransferase